MHARRIDDARRYDSSFVADIQFAHHVDSTALRLRVNASVPPQSKSRLASLFRRPKIDHGKSTRAFSHCNLAARAVQQLEATRVQVVQVYST